MGRGTAIIVTGEDDADEVHRRLESIDPTGMRFADSSRLIVLPLLSAGGAHAIVTDGPRGPELTPFWHELRAQLAALPDLALVVLDPLTQFIAGDTNDNTIGAALMSEMNKLAAETGATVMFIHHFAKAAKITGLSDARGAVLGAGAWVNNSRWAIVLWEATRDEAYSVLKPLGRAHHAKQAGFVYFGGLTKSNAPGAKVLPTLVRNASNGVLEDVTDELRQLAPKHDETDAVLYADLMTHKLAQPAFLHRERSSLMGGVEALHPKARLTDHERRKGEG